MNGAGMKIEAGSNTFIKPDPDGVASVPMSDDEDIYEDTGDLDFSNSNKQIWMTRLPESLWDAFNKLKGDDEIVIGRVRVEKDTEGRSGKGRVSLMLHDLPQFTQEPKEYILHKATRDIAQPGDAVSQGTSNTFIFSEKDMPGFKSRAIHTLAGKGQGQMVQGRSFLYEDNQKEMKRKENRKRWEPYGRKAIPKQTSIIGAVAHEFSCRPVANEEYDRISVAQLQSEGPRSKLERINFQDPTKSRIGAIGGQSSGNYPGRSTKSAKRGQDNKVVRIARNVLIDQLLELFGQYPYWSLKNLRARLQQPEAYLRQVLEDIAVLIRQGDFAMTWTLKDEYKDRIDVEDRVGALQVAPDAGDSFGMEGLSDTGRAESGLGSEDDDEDPGLFESVA